MCASVFTVKEVSVNDILFIVWISRYQSPERAAYKMWVIIILKLIEFWESFPILAIDMAPRNK